MCVHLFRLWSGRSTFLGLFLAIISIVFCVGKFGWLLLLRVRRVLLMWLRLVLLMGDIFLESVWLRCVLVCGRRLEPVRPILFQPIRRSSPARAKNTQFTLLQVASTPPKPQHIQT